MVRSAIDICSMALIKIGANSISSFDEGTFESQVAASLYSTVRDAILSAHPWNFALAQKMLPKLAADPIADFSYAYQLPPDCLHVISAGIDGRGRGLSYRILERNLHSNADEVVLTYIFRPHEANFPPFFDIALIARLASEFCIPLTDSTARWESLYKLAEHELKRAKLIDAREDATQRFDGFSLTQVRQ